MKLHLSEIAQFANGKLVGADALITSVSIDSRTAQPGSLFIPLVAERDGHEFIEDAFAAGSAACFSEKELKNSHTYIKVENSFSAMQEFAKNYLARFENLKTVGITGSVGKTTTKDFTAEILETKFRVTASQGSFNNEIGVSLTIFEVDESTEILVLELGAYKVGEIAALAKIAPLDAAVITRIGQAHIASFGSLANIAKAKAEIFDGLKPYGIKIINADDNLQAEFASADSFFIRRGTGDDENSLYFRTTAEGFELEHNSQIQKFTNPIINEFNIEDAAIAAAIGLRFGIELSAYNSSFLHIRSPHRMHLFAKNGISFIDDSYNANPDSMRAAFSYLKAQKSKEKSGGKKIAVIGDMLELGQFAQPEHLRLGFEAQESGAEILITAGEFQDVIQKEFLGKSITTKSNDEVFAAIKQNALAGDCVLIKASYGIKLYEVADRIEKEL